MTPRFACRVPLNAAALLAPARAWTGVEVCETPDGLWMCTSYLDDDQIERLRRVPGINRFTVANDGQLVPLGRSVPKGRLPTGTWQPLSAWMRWELPPPTLPATRPAPGSLRLIRTNEEREPNLLATTAAIWGAYAVEALQVRLARWAFAADSRGRVVVRGTPLPPIRGPRFVEQAGLAVPVGWSWFPQLPADVVRAAFAAPTNDLVLWSSANVVQSIGSDDWVQASRSAVRRTLGKFRR